MKISKFIICISAAVLTASFSVSAQEDAFSDFDSMDSFGDDFGASSVASNPFSIGGEAKIAPRLYVADTDEEEFNQKSITADPYLKLNLGYETDTVEFEGRLAVSKSIVTDYKEDILNELTMRVYLGNFIFEGGKEKIVWGKGDKLHVLDNFNANDYTDFIIPDYIDRRIAEPMLRLVWNSPYSGKVNNIRMEGIWTPLMTPDRLGTGRWMPASAEKLSALVTKTVGQIVASTSSTGGSNTVALTKAVSIANDLYPDTKTLEYGQAGIRLTGTIGILDLGLSYYYGHYKTPSVNAAKMGTYISDYLAGKTLNESDKFLAYDKLQVFGIEAGGVFGPFNTRAEFGYYLTDDTDGNDVSVRNNSLNYLVGFDADLPIHNINVNIQETGSYILNSDDIDKNTYDTEYDKDGIYTNNKIVLNISDSYAHEKVKPEVTVLYGIERSDLVIQPKITYSVKPGFELSAQGMILMNFDSDDKSEFQPWVQNNNSFVQIGVKYSF